MKTAAYFRFLGTGASMGIPVIGCKCAVCLSKDPHNHRTRPSALITIKEKKFLIDCGPDFRTQALRHRVDHLDGVILTHAHHDHTAGLDELRVYFMHHKTPLPCLLSSDTADDVKQRLSYFFNENAHGFKLVPKLSLHIFEKERGHVLFEGLNLHYMTYEQARMRVNGYRFGNLAYITDICDYPQTIFEDLKGVEILIISALRFTPSPIHFSVDDAIGFARKAGVKETWLTHIAHELDHEKTNAYLPQDIRLGIDGLEIPFLVDLEK